MLSKLAVNQNKRPEMEWKEWEREELGSRPGFVANYLWLRQITYL